MRNEIKFSVAMKKFLFSLLFIAGEMKCNFAIFRGDRGETAH